MGAVKGLGKRITTALGVSYLGLAALFASSVVIARVLGVEGKGTFSLFMTTVSALCAFSSVGIGSGQMFHASRTSTDLKHFMSNAFVLSFVLGGSAAVLYFLAGHNWGIRSVSMLGGSAAVAASLSVPVYSMIVFQRQYLLTTGDYTLAKLNGTLALSVPLIALAAIYPFGDISVNRLIIAVVIGQFACFVLFQRVVRSRLPEGATLSPRGFSRPFLRRSLSFGIRTYLSELAEFAVGKLDFFLVAGFLGASGLGLYSVAVALAEIVSRLSRELATILFPAFASGRIRAGQAPRILRVSVFFGLLVAAVLGIFSEPLVVLLFGEDFREAVAAFRWLLVGTVAWTSVSVTWSYANASGRPQIGVPIFTAAAVTDVVLNVMLLGRLGIVGAGIAATVSYWIAAILFLRLFCVLEACTLRDALVVRPSDLRHIARVTRDLARALVRWRRRQRAPERVRE